MSTKMSCVSSAGKGRQNSWKPAGSGDTLGMKAKSNEPIISATKNARDNF